MNSRKDEVGTPSISDSELAESVAAIKESLAELDAGYTGRPAREALRESCERLGVVIGVKNPTQAE